MARVFYLADERLVGHGPKASEEMRATREYYTNDDQMIYDAIKHTTNSDLDLSIIDSN